MLKKKLDASDQLVREEKFPRAAIVANDINTILSGFDPKLYFPRLFPRFSQLFAIHISQLAEYADLKESLEWQAMDEFYKVDIDAFLELE